MECYDYVNVLAFVSLLKYENRNSIAVDDLIKFNKRAIFPMKQIDDNYDEDEDITNLKRFVATYKNYFEINDDVIKLKEGITYDEINDLAIDIMRRDNIDSEISTIGDDMSLLSILGISTLRDMLVHYLSNEVELEECYSLLYTSRDNAKLRDNINKLLKRRALLLIQINLLEEPHVDAMMNISSSLAADEVCDYPSLPVNMDLYQNSEYYDDENDMLEDNLYGIYQYAIFGSNKDEQFLATIKLSEDISNIYYRNKFQDKKKLFDIGMFDIPYENNAENDYQEDRLFYLMYLAKLRAYMLEYGSDKKLMTAYKRLLYVMDSYGDKLHTDNNLNRAINNMPSVKINEDSYIDIHDEIYFIADEVFATKKKNKNTILKLLMLSTYYEITHDDNLVNIISRHKKNINYADYYDIIFGHSKGRSHNLHK